MLKKEWKSLLNNKLLLVVVIAIITIPTIYTTLFLGSMWDPYGNIDQLPVAVVNKDQPVIYNDKTLKVGAELVDNLKKEDSLCFNFVDEAAAKRGLKNGTYYMVITIPENFSGNASTLMDEKPEKMELQYATNPGTNYIASKMSETAMEKIKGSITKEVTKTYTQTVFDQIVSVGDGMQEAADGTSELNDGVASLADGNQTITSNLKTLSDSSLTFKEGSDTLSEGLKEYTDGVATADNGAAAISDGASQLKAGTEALNSKVPELSNGVTRLSDGSGSLLSGTRKTLDGGKHLKDGARQVDDNLSVLNNGLLSLKDETAGLPESAGQLNAGAQALDAGASQLQSGIGVVSQGAQDLQSGVNELNTGLTKLDGTSDALITGFDNVEQGIIASVSQMLKGSTTPSAVTSGLSGIKNSLAVISDAASSTYNSAAQSADAASALQADNEPSDVSYLSDTLAEAAASGDLDAVAAVADEAIAAAQTNYDIASAANSEVSTAASALLDSSSALTEAGDIMSQAEELTNQLTLPEDNGSLSSETASANPIDAMSYIFSSFRSSLVSYTDSVKSAKDGSDKLQAGINGNGTPENPGLMNALSSISNGIDTTKAGLDTLSSGTQQLEDSTPALIQGITEIQEGGAELKEQGTSVLKKGSSDLYTGLSQIAAGSSELDLGTKSLAGSLPELSGGIESLAGGASQLNTGASALFSGTAQLVSNNSTLKNGASSLSNGASQISSGAGKLYDGSQQLDEGIHEVSDGTQTLNTSLSDGAAQIKETKTNDGTVDMFASPVETKETKITTVENNGHAMAPYMMSVALWVGCIAFSLMYPLTKYHGKLKSGFSWWLGKASVLYLTAILQAVVMILLLHVFDGFAPVEMGKTIAVACLASVAFMSVMYFFTNSFGKVGSFLMLIFMVIQLAGSVGTYPLELSGSFVPALHGWVPFTYTVQAFRSTICGGESIAACVIFLCILWLSFTLLTIIEFQLRARKIRAGRHILADWLEEKGLA